MHLQSLSNNDHQYGDQDDPINTIDWHALEYWSPVEYFSCRMKYSAVLAESSGDEPINYLLGS